MKKIILITIFSVFAEMGILNAQTYEAYGHGMEDDSSVTYNPLNQYQIISFNGDRMGFYFFNLPTTAWGNVTLRLFFEGDDGGGSEFVDAYDETGALMTYGSGLYLGTIGPHPTGNDCEPEDSIDILIPAVTFSGWAADDTIRFYIDPSFNVDQFCTNNWARVKLIYNYCTAGPPVQFANFTASDTATCPLDAPVTLNGTPAGGTFSGGPYISGNTFVSTGLSAGAYNVTYVATDGIGCTTSITKPITVGSSPNVNDINVCPGFTGNVDLNGSLSSYYLYDDLAMTQLVDSGNPLTTQVLYSTNSYYIIQADRDDIFTVDTVTNLNFAIVDHDAITGDDRGGIAITPTAFYINGDNGIARYDVNLGSPSGTLPIRDGLFSDLRTGELWTLYDVNSSSDPQNSPSNFNLTGFRSLDSNMNITSSYLPLSMPIALSNSGPSGYVGIFASYGYTIIYNDGNQSWYAIDMDNGDVQNLGTIVDPEFYGSENWAIWGVAEYDGAQFSVLFRDNIDQNIHRRVLPAAASTIVATFPDLSDMASFTYSPWNDRWYFHYESSTSTFGGTVETSGYADGADTIVNGTFGPTGCPNTFDAIVGDINLGPDATACQNAAPVILEAGIGYTSYTWNGVNNNWNIFPAMTSGQYIVDAMDIYGCSIADTINVTINACLGIEENKGLVTSVYPNPSNGNFKVQINPNESGTAEIEIIDMQGRKLFTRLYELTPGIQEIPVQLFDVMDGIYLINIRFNDHQQNFRLVIKN